MSTLHSILKPWDVAMNSVVSHCKWVLMYASISKQKKVSDFRFQLFKNALKNHTKKFYYIYNKKSILLFSLRFILTEIRNLEILHYKIEAFSGVHPSIKAFEKKY